MKKDLSTIRSWRDADRALRRMGRLKRRLCAMRARADARIQAIEERLGEASEGLLALIATQGQELECFFRANAAGVRSRLLPSGRIGLRLVSRLEIARPQTTLRRLSERGLGDCIRLRQEIDRQALNGLDEKVLRSVGVKRIVREKFYVSSKEHE